MNCQASYRKMIYGREAQIIVQGQWRPPEREDEHHPFIPGEWSIDGVTIGVGRSWFLGNADDLTVVEYDEIIGALESVRGEPDIMEPES